MVSLPSQGGSWGRDLLPPGESSRFVRLIVSSKECFAVSPIPPGAGARLPLLRGIGGAPLGPLFECTALPPPFTETPPIPFRNVVTGSRRCHTRCQLPPPFCRSGRQFFRPASSLKRARCVEKFLSPRPPQHHPNSNPRIFFPPRMLSVSRDSRPLQFVRR